MEPPPPTVCPCPGCASPRADAWLGQTLCVRDSLPVGACCRHQSKHGAFPLLLSKQDQPRLSSTAGLRQQEQPGPVLGSISTAFPDAECFLPTCSKLFLPANINLAANGPSSEQDFSRKVHPCCPTLPGCWSSQSKSLQPCCLWPGKQSRPWSPSTGMAQKMPKLVAGNALPPTTLLVRSFPRTCGELGALLSSASTSL